LLCRKSTNRSISNSQRLASPSDAVAIKQFKEPSMDPLDTEILHEHVHCYIAQHFTGKDLLAMSEVSKSWNKFAESHKIGDKVHLKLDSNSIRQRICQIKSRRDYKEVSITCDEDAFNEIWRFNEEVEKMTVEIKSICDSQYFPSLKNLDLTVTGGQNSWIFDSEMELEELKLSFEGDEYGNDDQQYVDKFLLEQKHLKRLNLSGCRYDLLDGFHIPYPIFQLEYLEASFNSSFMNSSRQSLQTFICVLTCSKYEVRRLLGEFPKLTKLEIPSYSWDAWGEDFHNFDAPLPINTTIKELSLWIMDDEENRRAIYEEVLSAVPRLESLEVEELTTELMEFIALNMKSLKKLKYKNAGNGALERYEAMKTEEVEGLNADIECSKV
jgi:hypothetical protein